MNNLNNPGILSLPIVTAIILITDKCPTVVFGGSIALNAVGLLNRPVADIDLFLPKNESLTKNGFLAIESGEIKSDTVTNTNGKEIQRTGIVLGGVKCCCFKVDAEELQHTQVDFLNRKINIQNVNYAIMAKMSYSAKNPKHKEDLDNINKLFEELF